MQATQDHVGSLISERHSDVRFKLEALVNAIATTDLDNINSANNELEGSLNALCAVVARQHWPSWLSDLVQHTHNYRTNHRNGLGTWVAHLKSVMDNRVAVDSHNWFVTKIGRAHV